MHSTTYVCELNFIILTFVIAIHKFSPETFSLFQFCNFLIDSCCFKFHDEVVVSILYFLVRRDFTTGT